MKIFHTTLVLLLFCLNLSRGQGINENSRFSIESSIGPITSDLLHNPINVITCIDYCGESVEQIPMPNLRWGIGLELKIGKRNHLGAGFAISTMSFKDRTNDFLQNSGDYDVETYGFRFQGIYFMHRYSLLKEHRMSLSIGNGIQYDRYIKQVKGYAIVSMNNNNFSYIGKLELAQKIANWHELTLGPLFRLAMRPYNDKNSYEKYLPFGYGFVIGWRTRMV